jgi:hypothetical protein
MTSIPIIFQGGSYGSYLSWLLESVFTHETLYDPFVSSTGSSHNLKNPRRLRIDDWLKNPKNFSKVPFLRVHPKEEKYHSFLDNTNKLTEYFGKSILIYPSRNDYLLHSNNYVYKIWDNFWTGPLKYIDRDNLYNNFPVAKDTPIDQVPTWIIREWLSYNFIGMIDDTLEWFLPDRLHNKNCLIIYINQLLYHLPETIVKIQNFINMPLIKDIDDVMPYHKKNISLQKYLNQDSISADIISAIKNNDQSLTWDKNSLTIITECWIQHWIRNAGYDFKCNKLNNFPTTSKALIQLL